MKWLLPSIFFMGSVSFAQNTHIPDTNFEQALIDLGLDDVLDNYVSTASIASVEHLYLFEKGISDLTGIEDFESLEFLDCEQNQLSTLDLSQNTFLKFLNCGMNQIQTLDLSQNLALENLSIHENPLASIDLSHHLELTHLTAHQTELEDLDLSQNSKLIYLIAWENDLEALNIQNGNNLELELVQTWGNMKLTCIQVDDAIWAENNLRNLGMSAFDEWTNFSEDCTEMSVVEVQEEDSFEIYPNPVKDKIHFSEKFIQVKIYSLNGTKILESKDAENINVNHLPDGTYFLTGKNERGKIVQTSFIKK